MSNFPASYARRFLPLEKVYTVTPGASTVRCRDGKIQYLGNSSFIQVSDDLTASLPDFSVTKDNFSRLIAWIQQVVECDEIFLSVIKSTLVCSALVHDVSKSAISLPLLEDTLAFQEYRDVDEIILRPTISNDYFLTIPAQKWYEFFNLLNAVVGSNRHEVVRMEISDGQLTLSTSTHIGTAKCSYAINDGNWPTKSWVAHFSLAALSVSPINFDAYDAVKVSFTDNTAKVLSPLLVETRQNETVVTQVFSPAWSSKV